MTVRLHKNICLQISLIVGVVLMIGISSCKDAVEPVDEYTYLEGQQIPNTEIFLPMGLHDINQTPKISPDGNSIAFIKFYTDPGT